MTLTEADQHFLVAARREVGRFDIACEWYFGVTPQDYQYAYHHLRQKNSTFLAGIACVAGDTLIYDPIAGVHVPIAEAGDDLHVLALSKSGFVAAKASPPSPIGKAAIYRVKLSNGSEIKATLRHRFLTPSGYERLGSLSAGSLVGIPSNPDPPILELYDPRCTRTAQGFQDCCSSCPHLYGGRLPQGEDTGQGFPPSQACACAHSRFCSCVDDLWLSPSGIHLCRLSHRPSSLDFVVQRGAQPFCEGYCSSRAVRERSLNRALQDVLRSRHSSSPLAPFEESLPTYHEDGISSTLAYSGLESQASSFQDACELVSVWPYQSQDALRRVSTSQTGCAAPLSSLVSEMPNSCIFACKPSNNSDNYSTDVLFIRVEEIEFWRETEFYDLHVPFYNNYVANGVINHNSGKTFIEAMSMAMDCLTIPYFRALSTSVTAKQAELGFQMFMAWLNGNPKLGHLIHDIKLRPWPIIFFKNYSEWEFRTAGTDASLIRGFEYDRIGYDEAGLDYAGETVKVLRGRLRGRRPNGLARMARMDVMTSPTDAPWLRERYDLGVPGEGSDLRRYLSMRVRTRDNKALTEEQIVLMEKEYTPEMIAVEMDAEFPDYGLSMFPKSHLRVCSSTLAYDMLYLALNPEDERAGPKPGYVLEEHPRYGMTRYEMPEDPNALYVMAGDPGTDDPPRRNAGCVGVLRVDVKPKQLVYFDWTFGHGSYMPFLTSYKYAIEKYRPMHKGIDTTSTQKGIQELAFDEVGIDTDGINFSHDKDAALNSLSLDITGHALSWVASAGIDKQMSTYTRETDKKGYPQDVVMTLAMLSLLARYAPGELSEGRGASSTAPRWNRKRRTTRGRRR